MSTGLYGNYPSGREAAFAAHEAAQARARTDQTREHLALLAAQADTAAATLDSALAEIKTLRTYLLANIERLGGDRAHNWDLQADLGNAETALWAAAQKARTVSRHARAGLDSEAMEGV